MSRTKYEGDYDSITNQRIKEEFVQREVVGCDEVVVSYILNKSYEGDEDIPFTWDDVENYYVAKCDHCRDTLEEIEEDEIIPIHKWKCSCCDELFDTKEDAEKCCFDEEENITYKPTEVWLCPFCEDEYETEEEAKDCICHYKETMYKCPTCEKYFLESDVETEPQEIYTWYRVSGFLYNKLLEYGEPVLDGPNGYYWGRGTFGQAILLDWVISQICADMEILEGQAHDWSKYWKESA